MAMLGNVRTHLSLRKLKSNNKEKNYAIYGTGEHVLRMMQGMNRSSFFEEDVPS